MPLKVTLNHPAYEKGVPLDVTGIGLIENGSTKTLTEEDEREFVSRNMMTVKDGLKGSEFLSVDGTVELKGGIEGALGVSPADISDTPPVVEPTGDQSPATSVGQIDESAVAMPEGGGK